MTMRRRKSKTNFKAMRRVANQVLAAAETKHVHRFRVVNATITQGIINGYPLLQGSTAPDIDTGGNFTTACLCEQGSKIERIDLTFLLDAGNSTVEDFEFMIYKDPDAILGAALDPANLFTNDASATTLLTRKHCLAYRMLKSESGKTVKGIRMRISRAALKRSRILLKDDVLRLSIGMTAAGANGSFSAYGKIVTRV